MKQLNTYIKEGLFDNIGVGIEHQIEEWIEANTKTTKYFILEEGDKYIVNAETVEFHGRRTTSLTNDLFEWGEVGEFNCESANIISLKGAPKKCIEFNCMFCKQLKSLIGLPQECEKIDCSYCNSLRTLEGAPKKCKTFDCHTCDNLKSLEGAPQECEKFWCSQCHELTSFKGGPEKCIEMFNGEACSGIKDFKGAPKVCDDFYCPWCSNLISLEGAPKGCSKFNCKNSKKQFTEREIAKYLK